VSGSVVEPREKKGEIKVCVHVQKEGGVEVEDEAERNILVRRSTSMAMMNSLLLLRVAVKVRIRIKIREYMRHG